MNRLTIGIRREDKNIWEKRVPLVPSDVAELIQNYGFRVLVEPALDHRAFPDSEYLKVGAEIAEDLSEADIIVGVKEIPISKFMPGKVYLFFSHVIKGQAYNMPMLKTIMEKNCTLVDYEKIESHDGKRLIFFGRYAGLAGMVESLSAYGKRVAERRNLRILFPVSSNLIDIDRLKTVWQSSGRSVQKFHEMDFRSRLLLLFAESPGMVMCPRECRRFLTCCPS